MRLYLAIATLMLVLIAHSEAEEEPTLEQHLANIQERAVKFGETMSEKAISTWKDFENSEFKKKATNWLNEQFQRIKQTVDDTFNRPE